MFEILHRIGIKAPPDQVYRQLATPEGVAAWWTTSTSGDRHAGGTLRTVFHAGGRELGAFELKLAELHPDRRVTWEVLAGPPEWLGSRISFELAVQGEYTVILFRHAGWREPVEFMYHCSTKWAVYLLSLKSLVETGAGRPSPHDVRVSELH